MYLVYAFLWMGAQASVLVEAAVISTTVTH